MITFPEQSIRSASAGTGVEAAGPMVAIVPPITMTVPGEIGRPEIGNTSPPMKAMGLAFAAAVRPRRPTARNVQVRACIP